MNAARRHDTPTLTLVERPPLDATAVAAMLGCTEAEGAVALAAARRLARVAVAQALRTTDADPS